MLHTKINCEGEIEDEENSASDVQKDMKISAGADGGPRSRVCAR